ncbi:unnamed protein product, partial [Prorocentrum cordatum]
PSGPRRHVRKCAGAWSRRSAALAAAGMLRSGPRAMSVACRRSAECSAALRPRWAQVAPSRALCVGRAALRQQVVVPESHGGSGPQGAAASARDTPEERPSQGLSPGVRTFLLWATLGLGSAFAWDQLSGAE